MDTMGILIIVLFFICFYGIITSKKMVKTIIFLAMLQSSVIVFFLSIGWDHGAAPPMGADLTEAAHLADPLPQALMITAIIIGAAVLTISLTMVLSLLRNYATNDWDTAKEKRGQE